MATDKPRITITLEPAQHDLLRRLAAYQKHSMSSIVVELIDSVAPTLERVCEAIEVAMQAKEGVRDNLRRVAEESEAAILPHVEASLSQLDMFLSTVHAEGKPKKGATGTRATELRDGGRGAGASARNPRPVITGVRSDEKITKAASKSQKKGRKAHAL